MTLARLRGLRHASKGPRKPMTRDTSSGVGGAPHRAPWTCVREGERACARGPRRREPGPCLTGQPLLSRKLKQTEDCLDGREGGGGKILRGSPKGDPMMCVFSIKSSICSL